MALPPLPDNTTQRLWLQYTSAGVEHELMVRPAAAASPGQILTWAADIAQVLATRMFTVDSVTGARYSAAGTEFSTPIALTPVVGVINATGNIWGQDPESTMLSIPFRSGASGRKGRVSFFTGVATTSWPDNNRYEPGESAPVDTFRINLVNVLTGISGAGVFATAIDGTSVIFKPYVNIRQNSYWQSKQR